MAGSVFAHVVPLSPSGSFGLALNLETRVQAGTTVDTAIHDAECYFSLFLRSLRISLDLRFPHCDKFL